MKKLSFFLMAMLMSIMGFAADYSATNTSNVSFTIGNKAYDNKIKIEGTEYQAIKLGTSNVVGDMSFTVPANTAKIHLHIAGWSGKSSAVTISASNGVALGTTEITATSDAGMTGNSPFTLSDASKVTTDYYHVIELSSPTTAETTITMTSVSGKYRVVIWGVNTEEATSGEQGETVDAPTFSATEANFTEAFNLTITSAEGTTLKYTTDKTDPTTSETAVVVESNTATVAISAKSTMVKAVAIKGELVSNIKSMTYCYVNSEATAYTVTEALAIYNEGLGLSNKLYIKGSVKSIEELNTEYGNATYTITDGESDLYIYRGKNFGGEKFTSADQLFVNDDLVLYGQLTSYNGNPQVAANSEIISRESKTKSILAEDLTFDAIALGDEVEAQTLTVTGANLTADIAATLDNEKFTVTPATLPAAGGDLTITPAADLTAGEHTAILTLTSGETVKEVALSILVKDVYSINWSVNGTIANETKVVAGDKLVLPVAPAAPDACSEKVFVGWTAAEEVNADGSDIEWVTAATVPTADATYYAVFATQEGEGGAAEEGTVTLAYTGTTTINMDVEANNAATVGLDATKWNVTATKGDNNNAPGLNKAGDVRIYYGNPTSNTITVTSLDETVTISTIVITYTGDDYSNGKILVNDAAVTGTDGTYEINANSFTITNGNTTNVQVRIKNIVINYTTGAAATYTDYSTTCEAEIEWMEMPLEITNLVTEVMEVEGAKYLSLQGRDDMNNADVMLFLNNYADVDDDYEVNAESSYMTFGGMELTVIEGVMTQTSETDKGTIYTGTVYASVTDEEEGGTMYVKFALTMYAAPATVLELTDAIVAINEELGTLTFNVATGEGEGYFVELSGYTAPGVHEGPQICLFETPEVVAYATYVETSVADGVITLKGDFVSPMGPKFDLTISGKLPVVEEPVELVGTVKRAVQLGESTIVLTHEADGTARIYNVVGENISEVSLEGVVPVDPEDEFDYLAISDIALTEDGKLVATNYTRCNFGSTTYGTSYFYLWNDLDADPTIWFQSNASSNSTYSDQGYTMAVKGTSTNAVVMTTGVHNTKRGVRMSQYTIIDGVYEDINNAGGFKTSDYYFLFGLTDNVVFNENNSGTNLELNALGENWVMDGNLIEPTEWAVPATMSENHIVKGVIAEGTLGKKYNGATYVTVGNQVLMVAPYADAEGKLAGVKILDVTAGFAAATEVAVADLDAAVEATAAATAVAVAENTLTITLVGDATLYTLTAELIQDPGPGTALENIAVEGKAVKAIVNGQLIIIKNGVQYNAQGAVVK